MLLHILGILLIFGVFVGMFAMIWKQSGFKIALLVYGVTAVIIGVIGLGVYLIVS